MQLHRKSSFGGLYKDAIEFFSFVNVLLCGTSECWFYGLQNAGLAIFVFLGNRIFSEKMVLKNIFTTGYFIATFFVYIDKPKEKWIDFKSTGENSNFH